MTSIDNVASFVVLPAITFALVYPRIVTHLSRGLVSPYGKADVGKRLYAAAIDGLLATTSAALYWYSDVALYLVAGSLYLLLRDAFGGQSIGKFLLGLVVVSVESGRACSLGGSVKRNLLLLLPGANVSAVFLEARTILRDPQGQRLGDRLAQTQVVEGLGARDLARSFQEWIMGVGAASRATGRRDRVPVRTDRAA